MSDKIFNFLIAFLILSAIAFVTHHNQKRYNRHNGTHVFVVYYVPSNPDTIHLTGSYELNVYKGTNQIICLGDSIFLETTAPIKQLSFTPIKK